MTFLEVFAGCLFALLAIRLYDRWTVTVEPEELPQAAHDAVWKACQLCGVPMDGLTETTNLVSTGKLAEVIYHAAAHVGVPHPVATVGDVVNLLTRSKG